MNLETDLLVLGYERYIQDDLTNMVKKHSLKFDKIGNWSEIKLEIIDAYAKEYSTII